MNTFKAFVAWVCFAGAVAVQGSGLDFSPRVAASLLASGFLGLGVGDIFLLSAYARMGAARTLVLFGFQPLFIGVAAHFLFHQDLTWPRVIAVLFFLGCLFVFSLERFHKDGHWEVWGLVAALLAVLLDNSGLLLSRWAFDQAPQMDAFQANVFRCTGALALFAVMAATGHLRFRAGWTALTVKRRGMAVTSSVFGCFLSLVLYLSAVKIGHLASISALGCTTPILAAALECALQRKPPSVYLMTALLLFLVGFLLLNLM